MKRRDFVLKIATLYNFVQKSDIRSEDDTLYERLSVTKSLVFRNEYENILNVSKRY